MFDVIMKQHSVDKDMIEIFLANKKYLIGVIHIDTLFSAGYATTLHNRLKNGEVLSVRWEINDVAA